MSHCANSFICRSTSNDRSLHLYPRIAFIGWQYSYSKLSPPPPRKAYLDPRMLCITLNIFAFPTSFVNKLDFKIKVCKGDRYRWIGNNQNNSTVGQLLLVARTCPSSGNTLPLTCFQQFHGHQVENFFFCNICNGKR